MITNPLFDANNRFLCIGENKGKKAYLISGQNIVWQKELEGEISKITVNKNGYVSVAVSNSGYKTVIIIYDPQGKELFKTYLAKTYALDMDISNDNKYLAIAVANVSGSVAQTELKLVSIEKVGTAQSESITDTYETDSKDIITNIKYQEKNDLIIMYDNRITAIQDSSQQLATFDNNTLFAEIELNNHFAEIKKRTTGILQTEYYARIVNTHTGREKEYKLRNLPKAIYAKDNVIAANYGAEVEFISIYGWLLKKYEAGQEMKDIVFSNHIAGMVYKDKLEIIHL